MEEEEEEEEEEIEERRLSWSWYVRGLRRTSKGGRLGAANGGIWLLEVANGT